MDRPEAAGQWSERNRLDPARVTVGSHKRAWWVCQRGHQWEAPVYSVALYGCGCPYCTGKLPFPGETDLRTLHPGLMAEWDEQNTADPAALLPSSHDKVWWRCALGHRWQASVFSRTREKAAGCPYCTGRKVLAGFNDLQSLQPGLARQWHPVLNGVLGPDQVTLGSNKKVWWRCAEGHVWQSAIYSRTRSRSAGCPVCAGKVRQKPASAAD